MAEFERRRDTSPIWIVVALVVIIAVAVLALLFARGRDRPADGNVAAQPAAVAPSAASPVGDPSAAPAR